MRIFIQVQDGGAENGASGQRDGGMAAGGVDVEESMYDVLMLWGEERQEHRATRGCREGRQGHQYGIGLRQRVADYLTRQYGARFRFCFFCLFCLSHADFCLICARLRLELGRSLWRGGSSGFRLQGLGTVVLKDCRCCRYEFVRLEPAVERDAAVLGRLVRASKVTVRIRDWCCRCVRHLCY